MIGDAARLWHKSGFEGSLERDIRVESIDRDLANNSSNDYLFDMEAASLLPASSTIGPGSDGPVSVEDKEKEAADRLETVELMKKIDTDRIPCPRLCGVTFGPGVGGLAVFHNGDIRKVWSWWESKNPTKRSTSYPGIIRQSLSRDFDFSPSADVHEDMVETTKTNSVSTSAFPRSLKDLHVMTTAAREAQWGGTEDEASSALAHLEGDSFFEDDSASSSDSGDEQNEDFLNNSEGKDSKDLYTQYFGEYQQPHIALPEDELAMEQEGAGLQDGTASDMLAPYVKVTFEYDPLVLNRQSVMLAKAWKLGDITINKGCGELPSSSGKSQVGAHLQQGKDRRCLLSDSD